MKARVIIIGPDKAAEMLRANTRNRPMREARVSVMARDMAEGQWEENGESIKVAVDGTIMDGQHRLCACTQSGAAFRSVLVTEIGLNAYDTIDIGAKRTVGDCLSVAGESGYQTLAATVSWMHLYLALSTGEGWSHRNRTNRAQINMLHRHPMIRDSSAKIIRVQRDLSGLIPPGALAAVHYVGSHHSAETADEFVQAVATGAGLPPKSPVLALRKRLTRSAAAQARLTREVRAALLVKAWNLYASGRTIVNLKYAPGSGETFPRAVGHDIMVQASGVM
jgi:hypothetical protein